MLFHDDDDVFNVQVCNGKVIIMYINIYYKYSNKKLIYFRIP